MTGFISPGKIVKSITDVTDIMPLSNIAKNVEKCPKNQLQS